MLPYFICVGVCLHVFLCVMYVLHTWAALRLPGTGVTDGCDPPSDCWALNLDLLEDHPVLLTTEPPFSLLPSKKKDTVKVEAFSVEKKNCDTKVT